MVFDTLYGTDSKFQPQPQMVEGAQTSADGKDWTLTLRDGLKFHDGTPVLARDCVASIQRWGKRDAFGQALMAATDELSAADDKTIRFRLKHPFPLLPTALGKVGVSICPMMPERLAKTDPFTQVTEMVGSGPFRFKADERVPGARIIYERNENYVPRTGGATEWTAGPKIVHFDRVEWTVIPDAATAMGALQNGEADWWELPTFDLLPLVRKTSNLMLETLDPTGFPSMLRFNHLFPPFDNPAIRRALLGAVNQADYMTAVAGTDPAMWRNKVGYFPPGSPAASHPNRGDGTCSSPASAASTSSARPAIWVCAATVRLDGLAGRPNRSWKHCARRGLPPPTWGHRRRSANRSRPRRSRILPTCRWANTSSPRRIPRRSPAC